MTYSRTSSPRGYAASTLSPAQIDEGFRLTGNAPDGLGAGIHHWCERWDLNADTAAGMCHLETGGWTSRIALDKNNPGGVGALNHDPYGTAHSYATVAEGIMRWLAHVAAYTHSEHGEWVALDWRYDAMILAGFAPGCVTQLWEFEQKYAHTFPESKYQATPLDQRYGAKVAARANLLIAKAGEFTMTGDDSRFRWMPDVTEFGYPKGARGRAGFSIDLGIVHYTQGTSSSGWLRGNNGSSTHYLTDRQMRPFEQHVREADAAWTAGNREYNLRGINVEGELPGNQWTPALIREFAKTTYPIWKRNNIPLVYLGRDNGPGKRGLIGHADVPNQDHTDPGSTFDWTLYINELRALEGVFTRDAIQFFPETGHSVGGGFLQFWLHQGGLAIFGYPITEEIIEDGRTVQYFERARFEHHPNSNPALWDVMLGLIGVELRNARTRIAELETA